MTKKVEAENLVPWLMGVVADKEKELGQDIPWQEHLPKGKEEWTAREIFNAVGRAFTQLGIPNNLEKQV